MDWSQSGGHRRVAAAAVAAVVAAVVSDTDGLACVTWSIVRCAMRGAAIHRIRDYSSSMTVPHTFTK